MDVDHQAYQDEQESSEDTGDPESQISGKRKRKQKPKHKRASKSELFYFISRNCFLNMTRG